MGVPTNPIVVCGSGPSLLTVPYDRIGLPLAAVSTAIKFTPEPRHWLLVDRGNQAHGAEINRRDKHEERGPGGQRAFADKDIEKVIPAGRRRYFEKCPNATFVARDKQTTFMGGNKDKLHYCFNRSMLFAIEWLSWRYDCLIFAGVDLQVDPSQEFKNERKARSKTNSRNHSHRMEYRHWEQFCPIAKEKGVLWLNWTGGGPLGRLLEDFDDWRRRHRSDAEESWIGAGLQPDGQPAERDAADPRMATVECAEAVPRHAPDDATPPGSRRIRR